MTKKLPIERLREISQRRVMKLPRLSEARLEWPIPVVRETANHKCGAVYPPSDEPGPS